MEILHPNNNITGIARKNVTDHLHFFELIKNKQTKQKFTSYIASVLRTVASNAYLVTAAFCAG